MTTTNNQAEENKDSQPATTTTQFAHGESMAQPGATGGMNAMDLARIRKEYGDLPLDESMIPEDGSPFTLFR